MNDNAAMWIPVRLLISIAIISFFTALVFIGSQQATESIAVDNCENDLLTIKQSLETMYQHGTSRDISDFTHAPGSKRVFSLTIPDMITQVIFGRTKHESNQYSSSIRYQLKDQLFAIHLPSEIQLVQAEFLENTWQPVSNGIGCTFSNGRIVFTAELVHNSTAKFILLYDE